MRGNVWLGAAMAVVYLAAYVYLRATCHGELCLAVGALAGPFVLLFQNWAPESAWVEILLVFLNVIVLFATGWGLSVAWFAIRRGDPK